MRGAKLPGHRHGSGPAIFRAGSSLGSFVLQTGGRYLFVSDNGSAKIQVVNLSDLP
jgi:hypothetical protein